MPQSNTDNQVDHLFLLVGTNPLPNWVVAKLLAARQGIVYLIATKDVRATRLRLETLLRNDTALSLTVKWIETAEADEATIRRDVKSLLVEAQKTRPGKYGLNYTGGTKMMAVHAYRTFKEFFGDDEPQPLMSYLDARRLELKFDQPAPVAKLELAKVAQYPQVQISVETLLRLHDEYDQNRSLSYQQQAVAIPAAQELVAVHSHLAGQQLWRGWCDTLKATFGYNNNQTKKVGEINLKKLNTRDRQQIVAQLDRIVLKPVSDWETAIRNHWAIKKLVQAQQAVTANKLVDGYRQLLACLKTADGDSLKEATCKSGEFTDSLNLAKWLDGLWLEHYTFAQLKTCQDAGEINTDGLALNVEPVNAEKREFEADVIALRGYQLFYCSCYTGGEPARSKGKLFEAVIRAAQLGGDEARIALVCCSDEPGKIQQEAKSDLQGKGQIRVFGREQLPVLAAKMTEWLNGQ
ncbi:MAG: hypothetical protein HOP19_12670 [Acidobacteria bacterium]|nr:hypothetical protein [Acidobacteriota bacterium]